MNSVEFNDRRQGRAKALVDAAYSLFLQNGYRNVGVANIVALAGVSQGTFYNYFDNKRHILDSVIDYCFDIIGGDLLAAEWSNDPMNFDDLMTMFSTTLERNYELISLESSAVNFLVFEAASIDAQVVERLMTNFRRYSTILFSYIKNGVKKGFIHPDLNDEVAGEVLLSSVMTALFAAIYEADIPSDNKKVQESLVNFVRAGFSS
ncbi:MAG: TetR/AcrR family transcriptional regulator [Mycobacteriaceae bacterium]